MYLQLGTILAGLEAAALQITAVLEPLNGKPVALTHDNSNTLKCHVHMIIDCHHVCCCQ